MKRSTIWMMSSLCLAAATAAAAATTGQFDNMCAEGMSMGHKVHTDCSVHETLDGKTYCFSSKAAEAEFNQHPKANLAKAKANFAKMMSKS